MIFFFIPLLTDMVDNHIQNTFWTLCKENNITKYLSLPLLSSTESIVSNKLFSLPGNSNNDLLYSLKIHIARGAWVA